MSRRSPHLEETSSRACTRVSESLRVKSAGAFFRWKKRSGYGMMLENRRGEQNGRENAGAGKNCQSAESEKGRVVRRRFHAAAFKGITETVQDIDLMIEEKDAETAKKALCAMGSLKPPNPNAQYKTRCFLEFVIDGIDVDFMAGFVIVNDGKEYDCSLKKEDIKGAVTVQGETVWMHSIRKWRRYYELMKREEKVKMIDEKMLFGRTVDVNDILCRMIAQSNGNTHDVAHFLKVYTYARLIGEQEELDAKTQEILETAAVIHDIACPLCREEKYGNANGKYQERESAPLVEKILSEAGVEEAVKERVSYLVCHHHTYTGVDGLDYQILLEADYLVNADEGQASKEAIRNAEKQFFVTKTGKELLHSIYLTED